MNEVFDTLPFAKRNQKQKYIFSASVPPINGTYENQDKYRYFFKIQSNTFQIHFLHRYLFNWTMSYRRKSTFPYPVGRVMHIDPQQVRIHLVYTPLHLMMYYSKGHRYEYILAGIPSLWRNKSTYKVNYTKKEKIGGLVRQWLYQYRKSQVNVSKYIFALKSLTSIIEKNTFQCWKNTFKLIFMENVELSNVLPKM